MMKFLRAVDPVAAVAAAASSAAEGRPFRAQSTMIHFNGRNETDRFVGDTNRDSAAWLIRSMLG